MTFNAGGCALLGGGFSVLDVLSVLDTPAIPANLPERSWQSDFNTSTSRLRSNGAVEGLARFMSIKRAVFLAASA